MIDLEDSYTGATRTITLQVPDVDRCIAHARAQGATVVTEPARPIGLPTATTSWPIRRPSASPSGAAGAPAWCTRTTARSLEGSSLTVEPFEPKARVY